MGTKAVAYREITDPTNNHAKLAALIAASHPEYSRVIAVDAFDPDAPDPEDCTKYASGIAFERLTEWGKLLAITLVSDPMVDNDEVRNQMVDLACEGVAGQFDRRIALEQELSTPDIKIGNTNVRITC